MQVPPPRAPAYAHLLMHELLSRAGIVPGMRVLVPDAAAGELTFLVAERVGAAGRVFALDSDERALAKLRDSAALQCFENVAFSLAALSEFRDASGVDAVIAHGFLMRQTDPAAAVRAATAALAPGGRLVFVEWHFESVLWPHTSHWPHVPLYRQFAEWSVETLRRSGVHVDMGLRLVNVFAEAGVPLPHTRSELHQVHGSGDGAYGFFQETLRELLPAMERFGIARASDVMADTFAQRLKREVVDVGGHAFLPLQVGAWVRV